MALPTYVNAGSNVTGAGATTGSYPASGMSVDDLALLVIEHADEAVGKPTPSGGTGTTAWTQLGSTVVQGGTMLTVWYAYLTSATPTGPTISDSGDHTQSRILIIHHASGRPEIHGEQDSVDATSDTSGSATGFTTTVADCLIVICAAGDLPDLTGTAEYSGETNANLGSLTERCDNSVLTGNGGSKGIWTGTLAVAGAIGATTYTKANAAVKAHKVIAVSPPSPPAAIPLVVHAWGART